MFKTLLILITSTNLLFGADKVLTPAPSSKINFDLPFTGGIHKGSATGLNGTVVLDASNQLLSGRLTVPISAIKTANDTRDCHMREALGIDYTNSNFPAQHVCNAQNQTPPTGPNSIVFPNIEFEFLTLTLPDGTALPAALETGKANEVLLKGRFSIHGMTEPIELSGLLTQISNGLRLQFTFPMVLKNHNIIVKPSQAGGITIKVGPEATVKLDLTLVQ